MASDGVVPSEWWASIPVIGALFGFALRLRGASKREIDALRTDIDGFKVKVAEERASNHYVKEVEDRLTKHLTRIEGKLDDLIKTESRKG